ncbi:MAG: Transcriptional regulator, MarR/EmrR family [Bacteroidetes bacterium]|nr:Transcriptional regulator, MarR/EmrR family [Bacteroidota bacterium]
MNNWDIRKSIGYAIMDLGRQMNKKINSDMAAVGDDVTNQQGAVLYFIAKSKNEDLIQQDIAETMGINKSAILRTIDILEKKGFVKRSPVANDRRKNNIEVTPEGDAVVDEFVEMIKAKEQALRKGFTKAEMDAFFKVLAALRAKICE